MSQYRELPIFMDTNVLLHYYEINLNIEDAINRIITRKYIILIHRMVENEIFDALTKTGKLAKQAKIAVQLMKNFIPYEDETEYSGTDTALMEIAKKEKGCVFTFDKKLKYRCRSKDIPVISLYKPGRLQLTGEIE
ncbi:MAG: hypothetical protein HeimC2_37680 [Candidatus Heimdallarchaeota archaeon LC_2]|nr:MAG: hypothetical protein HeimC2_37680 [Candidatus Heimdallarchaeota archaeon LC_2]